MTAPDDVTLGIAEHQAAGTAARVDAIQAQWHAGGVRPLAVFAMFGDLVFIGIYGAGSWIAGRSFMRMGGTVRTIGAVVAAAALVFVLTDYTETLLQLAQLLRDAGSDRLAGIAAAMRPIKIAAWAATFVGVVAAWLILRLLPRPLD
ncbi:hypothetical protein J121_2164 [Qipengyuania citrea LAMA 915]|uniref:Uncharacterized protein n=1 Tax=Qipengyuania citrea LAMA 915 TaxID=1306953 RepID=A0A0L1KB30_9SPHN|nr:hypothetical protein [Qipengyuania citrea]KNH01148.1 hypothetical protein J121_2164 [Qipengyuania citrea LAMA 915]